MMDAQNIGDMLHIIILSLILVWLIYHQWLITKMLDLMQQIMEKLAENCKEATKEPGKNDSVRSRGGWERKSPPENQP